MNTPRMRSCPVWLQILLRVLRFVFSLLCGGSAMILALTQSLDPLLVQTSDVATSWFWSLFVVGAVLALVLWAFVWWLENREETENELLERVLEYIADLLTALKEETGKRLREIPAEVVARAARAVYKQYIEGTKLAIIPEEVFVNFVIERWRQIAGIEGQVFQAL